MDKTVAPKHISDLVVNIKYTARNFQNITFAYRNKTINSLADRLAKEAHIIACNGM